MAFFEAYVGENASCFGVTGAVVGRRRDALTQEPINTAFVGLAGVNGVCKASFVRESDLLEPVEDMEALSTAAHWPLWCVIVGVDEAWNEEIAWRYCLYSSIGG